MSFRVVVPKRRGCIETTSASNIVFNADTTIESAESIVEEYLTTELKTQCLHHGILVLGEGNDIWDIDMQSIKVTCKLKQGIK